MPPKNNKTVKPKAKTAKQTKGKTNPATAKTKAKIATEDIFIKNNVNDNVDSDQHSIDNNLINNNSTVNNPTKTIEEKYQKKTQIEHILLRPDTYVGDISKQKEMMWIWDKDKQKIAETIVDDSD